MADVPSLVDEVRAFLLSTEPTISARIPELAKEYADVSIEVNRRLARCQRLLQQGLRVEALHLAREAPDLIDTVQALDFPERGAWTEAIGNLGFASPPNLDLTAVEFIQSAYVDEDPLKEMLRQHRRLALARAPLKGRLELLRKIATSDPNNLIWSSDIQVFENARIEQLQVEVAQAIREKDIPSLRSQHDELAAKSWGVQPPKPLLQGVKLTLDKLNRDQVVANLSQLIVRMHNAFDELDEDECRDLRKLWRQLEKDSGRPAESSLFDQVRPIFQWLEQKDMEGEREQEYFEAQTALAEELEEGHSLADLYACRDALLAFDPELPEHLKPRLERRIAELQKWWKWVRVLAVATTILVLGATLLVGWMVAKKRSDRIASENAASGIIVALDRGNLIEAKAQLDAVAKETPRLLATSAVSDARLRLTEEIENEEHRASGFRAKLVAAEKVDVAEVEHPDLKAAEDAAVTADEKRLVKDLLASREGQRNDARLGVENKARSAISDLASRVKTVRPLLDGNETIANNAIDRLQQDHDRLAANIRNLSESVRDRYDDTGRQIQKLRDDFDARAMVRASEKIYEDAALRLPYSPTQYVDALSAAAKDAPSNRKIDLNTVVGEKKAWIAALEWAQLIATWRASNDNAERITIAKVRADACRDFIKDHPNMPDLDFAKRLQVHYMAVAGRAEKQEALIERLTRKWMVDVYIVRVTRGSGVVQSYYSKEDFKPQARTMLAFKTYRVDEKKFESFPPDQKVDSGIAPHSELAKALKKFALENPALENWDTMLIEMGTMVAADTRTDAIMRLNLLRDLMRIAGEGSVPLAKGLAPVLERVKLAEIRDDLMWMDPDDKSANKARPEAAKVIQKDFTWATVSASARAARKAIEDELAATPQPVGRLIRGKDGTWTCGRIGRANQAFPAKDGELRVIVIEQGKAVWRPIGQMTKGVPDIKRSGSKAMIEGRVVFLSTKNR